MFSSSDSLNPKAATMILDKTQKEIGEYPLWQPWIFSGMPTAESFTNTSNLYFLQYFFQLLHIPPIIIHLLHFFFAGLGVYILLRYLKISQIVAIIGSSGFMMMPYLITMEVFGHGSQAMTAAYIPWAFWAALKLFDKQRILDAGILAIILGLQLQRAHVQIAYYTWMLIGALFIFKIILSLKEKELRKNAIRGNGLFITAIIVALGISALVYLPSLQYSSESIRSIGQPGSASYDYATSWSFHPKEMLTFFIPSAYGFGGQTYWGKMPFTDYPNYMGIIFLLLGVFAIIKNRNAIVWFLAGTTLMALLISFGRHFGLIYNLFYDFAPYFSKFRIPSMILIIVQFNTIILACYGLEQLVEGHWKDIPKWFWWIAGIVGFAFIILLFGGGWLREIVSNGFTPPRTQDPRFVEVINNLRWKIWSNDAWLMIFFILGIIGSFILFVKEQITKVMFIVIIGALAIIDLGIVDYKIVQPEPNSGRSSQLISKKAITRYFQHDKITKFLTEDKSDYRVYPIGPLFSESRLQAFGIESVGGYHPAKLGIYNRFLSNTNNISTLPLMRMMNIRYILSPQVINHPDLEHVYTENMQTGSGKTPIWIYLISNSMPRAWFVDKVEIVDENDLWQNLLSESFNPAQVAYINEPLTGVITHGTEILEYASSIHHINLKTNSQNAGFLVISEVYYPLRWKAKIDGKAVKTFETNGIIRGIEVPAGEHNIEFEYDKSVFHTGIFISILSFILAIGLIGYGLIKNKKLNELV
ncbi:YfhO family protein [bacterium]|nr:YfhO family protein [bacterium]